MFRSNKILSSCYVLLILSQRFTHLAHIDLECIVWQYWLNGTDYSPGVLPTLNCNMLFHVRTNHRTIVSIIYMITNAWHYQLSWWKCKFVMCNFKLGCFPRMLLKYWIWDKKWIVRLSANHVSWNNWMYMQLKTFLYDHFPLWIHCLENMFIL